MSDDASWDWIPYRSGYAIGHEEVERVRYAGGTVAIGSRQLPTFDQVKARVEAEGAWEPEALELLREGYEDAIAGRRPRY